jgi:atypical dual specificity phosphatase
MELALNLVQNQLKVEYSDVKPLDCFCLKVKEIAFRLFNSPVMQVLEKATLLGISITLLSTTHIIPLAFLAALTASVALIALTIQVIVDFRKLLYETSLTGVMGLSLLCSEKYKWWSNITDQLVLGGIPLKNKEHDTELANQLKVGAVLSILEDFELTTPGVFSLPCQEKDWKSLNVIHHQVSSRDFYPISLETMETGVDFLDNQIKKGVKCYVHCKAGRSRSASVALAYLLKKAVVKTIDEGIALLQKARPIVENFDSIRPVLNQYLERLKQKTA